MDGIVLVAAVVSVVWSAFSCVFGVLVARAIQVAEVREMSGGAVDGQGHVDPAPDPRPHTW